MVAGRFCSEFALAFEIGQIKVLLHIVVCAFGARAVAPELNGVGKDTGAFKVVEGCLHGVHVGDGVEFECNLAAAVDVAPQGFERLRA